MATLEQQQRLNEFFQLAEKIENVNINLGKTKNSYTLEVNVPEKLKPLTTERLSLVQDVLSYSDIFDYIKIKLPNEPIQVTVTDNAIVPVIPTEQYVFVVDSTASIFYLKIGNLDEIAFTNNFNNSDFFDCNLDVNIFANPQFSASKQKVYITDKVDIASTNNDLFTLYYLTTGSLVIGFSPKDKPYGDDSYYTDNSQTYSTVTIDEKNVMTFIDPFGYSK